jgi:uncharacterized integral membrane protein
MEYLAILASIFLPLTLFTVSFLALILLIGKGVFGMNIVELGQGQLDWRIPAIVSIVGTAVVCILILLGKKAWKGIRERDLNEGWRSRYKYVAAV